MAMCISPSRLLAAASTWLLAAFVSAQVTDDFADGDYILGTAWSGDNALYVVVDDGGNQRLRSNSAGAANYYLSTPSTSMDDTRWEFFVDLRFSTSGANYADVYLASDGADLSAGVNGYFLRIGGTSDRVELFRSDGGTAVSIGLQSPDGVVNSSTSNPFLLRTERTSDGTWTLQYDDGATGTYTMAGSVLDATYSTTTHFGVRIEQSVAASAVNNHFFDDFSVGPIPVDNTPPTLLSATAVSATQADLLFSEAVDATTAAESLHYAMDCGATVNAASVLSANTVRITFAPALVSGTTCMVTVNGVLDLANNACNNATASFLYFVADVAVPGDVIINEIMADPSPAVGLPDAEFIEVFNTTTDRTFDLAGWFYSDGGDEFTLPTATLPPGGHVIITSTTNVAALSAFGTTVAPSGSVSLTNTDDPIVIKDPGGTTIDAVTYADDWYNDVVKALGGWTLERIDPTTPCSSAANWTASNDALGGTPGEQNSVYAIIPDVTAPTLVNIFVSSDAQIELLFNETMNAASLAGGSYQFTPALSVDLVTPTADNRVQITFAAALVPGQIYTVTVTGVTDCAGNAIGASNTLTFALPEPVLPGDVVINEVLYDPLGSGSDFVELYNRSNKVLSLAGWKLANETDGVIGNGTVITSSAFLLLPGQYALIAESANDVEEQYPLSHTDRFVEASMPSYNNGEGVVVLQDAASDTLDRFAYNDDLHFELLNSTDGVSIERVNPDRPTSDNTNWHSAAEAVGYATPGYRNSQFSENPAPTGELTIDPAIFSPDNDGYQDLLTVAYKLDEPGFTGTMSVFDVAGREVVKLMDNELLGTSGAVSWNGIMEDGDLARMGPYIVVFEAFDLQGNVERFRETVVLAHKLN
jgi:hypothetical protein